MAALGVALLSGDPKTVAEEAAFAAVNRYARRHSPLEGYPWVIALK